MKRQIKNIDVKDFLKELSNIEEDRNCETKNTELISKIHKEKPKVKAHYEVVFSDSNDFAIRKSGKKTSKLLVSIFSKGFLYILNEQRKIINEVVDEKQLTDFFNDVLSEDVIIPKGTMSYCDSDIYKSEIHWWYEFTKIKAGARLSVMSNVIKFKWQDRCYLREIEACNSLEEFYEKDKALYGFVMSKCNHVYNLYELKIVLSFIYAISKVYSTDAAHYAMERYVMSSVNFNGSLSSYVEKFSSFRLNIKRFIDYIFFDMYKQGITTIDHTTYFDYLIMAEKYYGYVKDKYPKHLRTEHDKLVLKFNEIQSISKKSGLFEKIMLEAEDFSYSSSKDGFIIRMPTKVADLVEEGTCLNHCIASYVGKIVSHDCIIVFMRNINTIDTPLLTIEILPDRSVAQIEGMSRRTELTEKEKTFIKHWAGAKGLKITMSNMNV